MMERIPIMSPAASKSRKESPDVFKPAQSKPSHALSHAMLLELDCWRCGVILFIEAPKGEASYTCVCGEDLQVVVAKAA